MPGYACRAAALAAPFLMFIAQSASALPPPGGGGGGGGNGGGGGAPSPLVDCRPTSVGGAGPDALVVRLASLDPDDPWRLDVRGTCTGDVIVNGFDNLILQSADPSPARATIAGSVVTTLTKLTLDRVDIAVPADNLGLLCGGLSDCYLSESNVTGSSTGADGVTVTGRSRASLVASNVSGFRMGLYVNNGSTAGFIAAAGQGTISNVLDGVYTLDGSFVSVEGNADGTRAQIVSPRRNGVTAFASSIRTRRMNIVTPGSTTAGFGLELRSGATAHVQDSTIGNKAGVYPNTGSTWPSVLLADLSHVFFVDGDPVALTGPIHCAGKYSSFDTFGSSLIPQSVGTCAP